MPPNTRESFDQVVLADPALRSNVGHYLTYAVEVGRAVERAGYRFHAIGTSEERTFSEHDLGHLVLSNEHAFGRDYHRTLSGGARGIADRLLGTSKPGSFRRAVRGSLANFTPLLKNVMAYKEFRGVFRGELTSETLVFLPTTDHRYAIGFCGYLRSLEPSKAPAVCMLWRSTYFESEGRRPESLPVWPRLAFRVVERTAERYRIAVAVETERLALEYGWLTRLPISILPIPLSSVDATRAGRGSRTTVACLGDAREEKGFDLVADAIARLRDSDLQDRVEFVVQCNTVSEGAERMVRNALPRLKSRNVRLVQTPLSRKDYEQILVDSDILLLPYERRKYWARTSYPFVEAILAGKPVITTSDTWMSDQIERYGGGLAIPQDAASVVDAIAQMVRSYPYFRAQAEVASGRWQRDHSPDTFVRTLMGGLEWGA